MATERSLQRVLKLLTAKQATIESLSENKKNPTSQLRQVMQSNNVVAVGISDKTTRGKPTGKLAITFYVKKKKSLAKLRGHETVPPAIPEAVGGRQAIPTDVVELGTLRPELNVEDNPVQSGFSIGHVKVSAGTLGAVVSRGKSRFLLSNSHVLANSGKGKIGDPILYPGKADGGKPSTNTVATLSKFKPFVAGGQFVNEVDCAVAKPTPQRQQDLVLDIKGLGLPRAGTAVLKRGMKVVKVGRTTGKTVGEIKDVNFNFVLHYPGIGEVGFRNQVLCSRYTQDGDSGSLVIEKETGRAVGLHFAGADNGSVFNPIGAVLKALRVKLITGP